MFQDYPNFVTDGVKDNQKICNALIFVNEVHVGFDDVSIKDCPQIMNAMEAFDPTAVIKDVKPTVVHDVETGKFFTTWDFPLSESVSAHDIAQPEKQIQNITIIITTSMLDGWNFIQVGQTVAAETKTMA